MQMRLIPAVLAIVVVSAGFTRSESPVARSCSAYIVPWTFNPVTVSTNSTGNMLSFQVFNDPGSSNNMDVTSFTASATSPLGNEYTTAGTGTGITPGSAVDGEVWFDAGSAGKGFITVTFVTSCGTVDTTVSVRAV